MTVHYSQANKEWADQFHKLVELWRAHIEDTPGHLPSRHRRDGYGDGATFDTDIGLTYIMCCAPGCDWGHTEEEI